MTANKIIIIKKGQVCRTKSKLINMDFSTINNLNDICYGDFIVPRESNRLIGAMFCVGHMKPTNYDKYFKIKIENKKLYFVKTISEYGYFLPYCCFNFYISKYKDGYFSDIKDLIGVEIPVVFLNNEQLQEKNTECTFALCTNDYGYGYDDNVIINSIEYKNCTIELIGYD